MNISIMSTNILVMSTDMHKQYHIRTHILLHSCRFYVYRMSCTVGIKSKYKNSSYCSKTEEGQNSVVILFFDKYYKFIVTCLVKIPLIVLKLWM